MSPVWQILAMGSGVYALRLGGLLLPRGIVLPPAWERALGFVPVALLTALVVSSLAGGHTLDPARLIAAAGAAVIARRTGRMWLCIAGGMALYWLLRPL